MSNQLITPKTLSGFMELLPSEQMQFEKIRAVLEETYRLYGFYPLDTPVLESSDVLLAKAGGETEKQIYRFQKGDNDLTMRFDLTVPLAKYVAKNAGELAFPFRRYQIGKVYRGERAQRGRFREFYQSDIDIIGDGSLSIRNDAEMPSIIYTIFTKLGLDDFVIRINNRKILTGFYAMLGLSDRAAEIMRIVDKTDKIGREKVADELRELGVSEEQIGKILDLMSLKGTNSELLASLRAIPSENEQFCEGVDELEQVIAGIAAYGVPEKNYSIDLSIARGLDYYTGTVYETTLCRYPEIGSVCSGGRYDNLAGYYTNRKLPGVGISIGLTRLFFILSDRSCVSTAFTSPADLLVVPMTDDPEPAFAAGAAFRSGGIKTQVYLESGKLKSKLNYANRTGIPFVLFIGEDELASGKYTLKNMDTGEQISAEAEELIRVIAGYVRKKESVSVLTADRAEPAEG
ncbi:MAG: histidine--tRNA ligase [Clostridia bacterium]|nr:histidine--tRNA ligase [Clostridia bacterium]